MSKSTAIVWFRRDLRIADNPALHHAISHYDVVIPVYLHCPEEEQTWQPGAASRWWLHHSLTSFQQQTTALGNPLVIRQGASSVDLLQTLIKETQAESVCWNRLYTPFATQRDRDIAEQLEADGTPSHHFNASLLREPWEIHKPDKTPYKVYTAWWKRCVDLGLYQTLTPTPQRFNPPKAALKSIAVQDLELLPTRNWDKDFYSRWQPGEAQAHQQLEAFLDAPIHDYAEARDQPGVVGTSSLSPHLHFGEIGPRQVINRLIEHLDLHPEAKGKSSANRYAAEIGWRDFAAHLLAHFPHTVDQPMNASFAKFPWSQEYQAHLDAWQHGQTGIPIVDAGMRELWQTGWMHNRVRMIVASFLTKNLLIPWQQGAQWFWDTLVDADLASNTMGWQWVAGSGADAAPYFRIFNPVRQGEKFDPRGDYIRRWVPELKDVANKYIHQPWNDRNPDKPDYPEPIVDLATTRKRALEAYKLMRR